MKFRGIISKSSVISQRDLAECEICHIVFDSKVEHHVHVMSHEESKKNSKLRKRKSKLNKLKKKKKNLVTKKIDIREIDEDYVPDEDFIADDEIVDNEDNYEDMFHVVDKDKEFAFTEDYDESNLEAYLEDFEDMEESTEEF